MEIPGVIAHKYMLGVEIGMIETGRVHPGQGLAQPACETTAFRDRSCLVQMLPEFNRTAQRTYDKECATGVVFAMG